MKLNKKKVSCSLRLWEFVENFTFISLGIKLSNKLECPSNVWHECAVFEEFELILSKMDFLNLRNLVLPILGIYNDLKYFYKM